MFFLTIVRSINGYDDLKPVNVRVALLNMEYSTNEQIAATEFLSLRRIFDIQGIPYDIITNTFDINRYKVVYSGVPLTNTVISRLDLNNIYEFIERGGVFVVAGEVGNKLYPLYGIKEHLPSRKRYRLKFIGSDGSLKYIDHPREQIISLGNGEKHIYDDVIWSHGYRIAGESEPLAFFDDGTVGFIRNYYGRGTAYLLGVSYTESVLLPMIGNDFEAQRSYVNSFEPSADVIMLILKAIYESEVDPFVYLSPIPFSKHTALILSHDVDAQTSFIDSLKFAELEKRYGVNSTFFETTKYFTDWMDIDYYNIEENVEAIRKLKRDGWDIGSHTVSHYKMLGSSPEGDPGVTFTNYDPENRVTVQGEVRVSKELLDRDIPGQITVSFRAGDLEFPRFLIRVLDGAGYLYDSTLSANDALTAFPFRALNEQSLVSDESNVMEIPVTLDDSMGYLTRDSVNIAVENWIDVARANMLNEALTVLLIHPSDTRAETYKLDAQEMLMEWVSEMGGWMGNLTDFGNFWRERDRLDFRTYISSTHTLIIEIDKKASGLNPMIGFVVGGNEHIKEIKIIDPDRSILNYSSVKRNGKLYLGIKTGPQ
jgi:peptidoglycan/xylan/chitin deacetylase (PgdA/CDA1 family)